MPSPVTLPDLEAHDLAWKREPGELWIKKKPDFCSLTLVPAVDGLDRTAGPAFTTRFKRGEPPILMADLENIEHAYLRVEFGAQGRLRITLRAFEHGCDDCPPPRTVSLKFEAKASAVEAFWAIVHQGQFFLWVLSCTTYEARFMIDVPTGKVTARLVTPRWIS